MGLKATTPALRKIMAKQAQERFIRACVAAGLPAPVPEFTFHPTRKWRFDYAWPEHKIAVEVEGGVWTRGRHTRGAGYLADMEKYTEANVMGWCVIRVTPQDLHATRTFAWATRARIRTLSLPPSTAP